MQQSGGIFLIHEHVSNSSIASPRNELEIQLFGLQRSGNHAVVTWLLQQSDKPVVFLNNVAHFEDPFLRFRHAAIPNAVPLHHSKDEDASRFEALRRAKKKLLVISYENLNLTTLHDRKLLDRAWVGSSERICRVLLFRDFYNWLASRARLFENKGQVRKDLGQMIHPHIRLWLIYAREFTGRTDYLGEHGVIRIDFTKWCETDAYRAGLLREIGLPTMDNSRNRVADVGGGSSFDQLRHTNRGSDMRVDLRWSHLAEDRYASLREAILQHSSDIDPLNREIFGLSPPF